MISFGSVHRPKFGEIRGPMYFLGGFIGGDFSIPTYEQIQEETGMLQGVASVRPMNVKSVWTQGKNRLHIPTYQLITGSIYVRSHADWCDATVE